MGGRGSTSALKQKTVKQPLPKAPKAPIAQQVPDDNNTPVQADALTTLSQMDDAQLAKAFTDSRSAQLPNHLNDVLDKTQKFVFHMGLNDKPMVLDSASFQKFMSDNNISQNEILARSVHGGVLTTSAGNKRTLTPQDVADMMMYSRLNYIGGKHGGQVYGAGTYFDMNGGGNTGYGPLTVNAVLNPKTAKVISQSALATAAKQFDATHPQFKKATGGFRSAMQSIYALAMGYNVIKSDYNGYHNIIDRKALVYRK